MAMSYSLLPIASLSGAALCEHPGTGGAPRVDCNSDAMDVMTDFRNTRPITVEPGVDIDTALERMKITGVRLLLVIEAGDRLSGIVSAEDIQGEKPVRYQRGVGVPRQEVRVRDIMVAAGELEVLDVDDVRRARVGDLVTTLERSNRQHILAREHRDDGDVVCGLFSARQVGRQLGVSVELSGAAASFSELETALAG